MSISLRNPSRLQKLFFPSTFQLHLFIILPNTISPHFLIVDHPSQSWATNPQRSSPLWACTYNPFSSACDRDHNLWRSSTSSHRGSRKLNWHLSMVMTCPEYFPIELSASVMLNGDVIGNFPFFNPRGKDLKLIYPDIVLHLLSISWVCLSSPTICGHYRCRIRWLLKDQSMLQDFTSTTVTDSDNSGWCFRRRLQDRSCSHRACQALDPKSGTFLFPTIFP